MDELEVISFRAWFEIFGIYQLNIKVNGKLLFHYSTSEIAKLDNEKLINKLKEGVKLWQNK